MPARIWNQYESGYRSDLARAQRIRNSRPHPRCDTVGQWGMSFYTATRSSTSTESRRALSKRRTSTPRTCSFHRSSCLGYPGGVTSPRCGSLLHPGNLERPPKSRDRLPTPIDVRGRSSLMTEPTATFVQFPHPGAEHTHDSDDCRGTSPRIAVSSSAAQDAISTIPIRRTQLIWCSGESGSRRPISSTAGRWTGVCSVRFLGRTGTGQRRTVFVRTPIRGCSAIG